MTRYELAKLMVMSGGIKSRKRIQKTVHLLQAAGCDFELEFRLHFFGPYSSQLAELVDWATAQELLIEDEQAVGAATRYDYRFNEDVQASFDAYERTESGQREFNKMEGYVELVNDLRARGPRQLELASTLVAFWDSQNDWAAASERTAEFKEENVGSPAMNEALDIAQQTTSFLNV